MPDSRQITTTHRVIGAVHHSRENGHLAYSYFPTMNDRSGFTLIELVVTVSILGILLAVGVPSFTNLIRDKQRSSAVNDLLADMTFARSEASRRGRTITVCSNSSGDDCGNDEQWASGWIVFEEVAPADGIRTGAEPIIRRAAGRTGKLKLASSSSYFQFKPFNKGSGTGGVKFCDPRGPENSRAIIVSRTGRVRADSVDGAGKPVVCP